MVFKSDRFESSRAARDAFATAASSFGCTFLKTSKADSGFSAKSGVNPMQLNPSARIANFVLKLRRRRTLWLLVEVCVRRNGDGDNSLRMWVAPEAWKSLIGLLLLCLFSPHGIDARPPLDQHRWGSTHGLTEFAFVLRF